MRSGPRNDYNSGTAFSFYFEGLCARIAIAVPGFLFPGVVNRPRKMVSKKNVARVASRPVKQSLPATVGRTVKKPVPDVVRHPLAPSEDERTFLLDRRARQLISLLEVEGNADDLLLPSVVAHAFGVSIQWLEIGRSNSRNGCYGPAYRKLGNMVFYRRDALVEWLRKRAEHFEATAPKKPEMPSGRLIVARA
jgi:hypothetical protein